LKFEKICVIGLGYIGLPTASTFATHGLQVIGVDVNPHVLETLKGGRVHIQEPGLRTVVEAAVKSGRLTISDRPEPADAFLIAVPTPFYDDHNGERNGEQYKLADMRAVTSAAEAILPVLKQGDLVVLDNFRNGRYVDEGGTTRGRWTSALVDLSKVKRAVFELNIFYVKLGPARYPAGHGQMIFEFEPGGILTPAGEVSGMVFSFEAYREDHVKYDPIIKGLKKTYRMVLVVSSARESLRRAATTDNGVKLFELGLTDGERRALLEAFLAESFDEKTLYETWYHTTRSSCVTNQFRVLNSVLPEEKRFREYHTIFGKNVVRTFGTTFPRLVGRTLLGSGMVTWHQEFACPDGMLSFAEERFGGDAFLGDPQLER